MFIIAFKTTRGAFKSYFVRVFTSFFVRHFDLVAPVMLINSGNITLHLKEHRVSLPSRNAVSGNGITKTETEMKRETETGSEMEYGICERFQTIDLKKNCNDNTINKQIK